MKVLLHREIPLVLDDDTDDVYSSTMYEFNMLRAENPEWEQKLWSLAIHTLHDAHDVKVLVVTVTDPDATDWRENLKVGIAILILGTLLFFIGLYG